MERTTVPFHHTRMELDGSGQVTTEGLVRVDDGVLIVEFRRSRTDWTTLKTHDGVVRVVRIPMDEVESIEVRRRWWLAPRLVIRTRSMVALAEIPGVSRNEVVLTVRRRDRDRARELAVGVSLLFSNRELRRLEGDTPEPD